MPTLRFRGRLALGAISLTLIFQSVDVQAGIWSKVKKGAIAVARKLGRGQQERNGPSTPGQPVPDDPFPQPSPPPSCPKPPGPTSSETATWAREAINERNARAKPWQLTTTTGANSVSIQPQSVMRALTKDFQWVCPLKAPVSGSSDYHDADWFRREFVAEVWRRAERAFVGRQQARAPGLEASAPIVQLGQGFFSTYIFEPNEGVFLAFEAQRGLYLTGDQPTLFVFNPVSVLSETVIVPIDEHRRPLAADSTAGADRVSKVAAKSEDGKSMFIHPIDDPGCILGGEGMLWYRRGVPYQARSEVKTEKAQSLAQRNLRGDIIRPAQSQTYRWREISKDLDLKAMDQSVWRIEPQSGLGVHLTNASAGRALHGPPMPDGTWSLPRGKDRTTGRPAEFILMTPMNLGFALGLAEKAAHQAENFSGRLTFQVFLMAAANMDFVHGSQTTTFPATQTGWSVAVGDRMEATEFDRVRRNSRGGVTVRSSVRPTAGLFIVEAAYESGKMVCTLRHRDSGKYLAARKASQHVGPVMDLVLDESDKGREEREFVVDRDGDDAFVLYSVAHGRFVKANISGRRRHGGGRLELGEATIPKEASARASYRFKTLVPLQFDPPAPPSSSSGNPVNQELEVHARAEAMMRRRGLSPPTYGQAIP